MTDYIKLVINGSNDEVLREILTAELAEAGVEAFDENEGLLNAYIQKNAFDKTVFDGIFAGALFAGIFEYLPEEVKQENWNSLWESNFEPVVIGNKCVIYASFHSDLPEVDYKILINPKMTFGTGHHETTHLCVQAILDLNLQGKNVLDMGCGTGILAILAAMSGAAKVTAIDNDPTAAENAAENAELNGMLHKMNIYAGEANMLANKQFDLIIANINRNVLLNDMDKYVASLIPDGMLVVSGFYRNDMALLLETAQSSGLVQTGYNLRNGWAVMIFKFMPN
ncbi:MAG: 50S ribosomal protein L11 methyltransferase [Prevotellaceae bacterium]|jgi:ribosomal protein L11 methyltransferase|nr:50S ribosomal protein L11 methyltransferase [Prevotellaceae bacterium]